MHPIKCACTLSPSPDTTEFADQVRGLPRALGVVYVAASQGLLASPSIAGFGCLSIAPVRAADSNQPNCGFELADALDLYLRLKGGGWDKVFVRAAHRNIGYVIGALGNRPRDQYASSDAELFRDWQIARDLADNIVLRIFSNIRSIVNLAIKEQGLECQNAFAGTFRPDGMRETARNPISTDDLKSTQARCLAENDDLRWLIALLSKTGMLLGEAVGLLKSDINLENDLPQVELAPHP